MMNTLRLLCDLDSKLETTGETGGIAESICITRSKGRFRQPTSGGWGDIMINFYFTTDEHEHICELQLVHRQLYNVRKNMGAHATYGVFRAALELLKMLGEDPEEGSDGSELAALVWTGENDGSSSVGTADLGGAVTVASDAFQAKLASLEALVSNLGAQRDRSEALKAELEATFKARFEAQDAEILALQFRAESFRSHTESHTESLQSRNELQDAEIKTMKVQLAQLMKSHPEEVRVAERVAANFEGAKELRPKVKNSQTFKLASIDRNVESSLKEHE
jgi:hypothetical protein